MTVEPGVRAQESVQLKPVKLPGDRSRADELYAWLREAIIGGELRPSERLVETVIADLASVSRTPVREALHRLEVDGLVSNGAGGLEVNRFSLDELADLCAVRETLEGMASELAASTRSPLDLEALRRISKEEEEILESDSNGSLLLKRVELNHLFHQTIWRASRNRYLASELKGLREMIEGLQDSTLSEPARNAEAVSEHRAILNAIELQRPDEAAQITRTHFRNAAAIRLLPLLSAST
jgi:DNA-binding GntR family transcriptional regulator